MRDSFKTRLSGFEFKKPIAAKALQMRRLSAFAFETITLRNFEKKLYEANASVKQNTRNTIKQLVSLKLAMKMQGERWRSKGGVTTRADCVIRKLLKLLEKTYLLCIILSWLGWSQEKRALMFINYYKILSFTFRSWFFSTVTSGGLRKGGGPVRIKWGGPFLYTLLYHVLSALAIKRNNAFHK